MTNAQVSYAERKAMEQFDKWNEVANVVEPNTGYYSEAEAVIHDAVHIGIQMALYGEVKIRNGEVIVRNVETTQQDGSVSLDV